MLWILLAVVIGLAAYLINDRLVDHRRRANPVFDPGAGNPHVKSGLDLLWRHDWPGLSALYRQQTPSDRYQFTQALARAAVVDTALSPDDADSAALAMACGFRVEQAWRFRGGGTGDSVSNANAQRMLECLHDARKLGYAALRINPHDSTAVAFLVRAEMGVGGDDAALADLMKRAQDSFEPNIHVAANHLQFVAPKWHGSVEGMWEAANHWGNSAPNAAWLAIPARAHIEEWLFSTAFQRPGQSVTGSFLEKMRDTGFLDHVRQLDDAFWEKLKAAPIAGAEASFAHNNFAFLLHILSIKDRVKPHLERVGPHITELPWGYGPNGFEEPMHQLAIIRRQYGLPALKRP